MFCLMLFIYSVNMVSRTEKNILMEKKCPLTRHMKIWEKIFLRKIWKKNMEKTRENTWKKNSSEKINFHSAQY